MNHWKCSLFVAAICITVGPFAAGQAPPGTTPHSASTPAASTPATTPVSADRAFLGVYIGNDADGGGVKIEKVEDGSPAAKAGLQSGDVITMLGDHTVGNEAELREVIASHQVGEKLKVSFLRDGEKRRTTARLAKAPADTAGGDEKEGVEVGEKPQEKRLLPPAAPKGQTKVEAGSSSPKAEAGSASGGGGQGFMGVQPGQDDEGRTTIAKVIEGTAAEKAGLKEGDVILAVDGTEVGSADELVKLVSSHKAGDRVTVTIERDGAKQKVKVKLGQRSEAVAQGAPEGRGAGGGAIAAPLPPTPPEATPPPANSKPAKMRGRIAAPAAAEGASGDAVKKEIDEMRAELEKTRKEMEDLRRKCDSQQRTLDAIKRALGGDREPQSMAAPESTPGDDGSAVITIPAAATSAGATEIAVAAPAKAADGGCDCCAAGEGKAAAAQMECTANGPGQIVLSSGEGEAQTINVGDGQTITLKDGQFLVTGKPLTTQDFQNFVIESDGGEKGAPANELKLDGQIELQLGDDGEVKQIHGNAHGGGHALKLQPTGKKGTFELVLGDGNGEEKEGSCCESGQCEEEEEDEEGEENEEGEKGGQTIVLQLADDGQGGTRVVQKAALGNVAPKHVVTKTVKVAPMTAHAFKVAPQSAKTFKVGPASAHTFVIRDGDEHEDVFVENAGGKSSGGNGSCEGGCCCCCGGAQPEIAFKAATPARAPRGGAPARMPPPVRARQAPPKGGMGMGAMPGMSGMPGMPGPRPGMARKADNGGGMELMRLLHSGASFTWKCDGPCELKVGPDGAEFHCEGSCEISHTGAPNVFASQPGGSALFRMLGTGAKESESDDADEFGSREDGEDDDDGAPAARTNVHTRVF